MAYRTAERTAFQCRRCGKTFDLLPCDVRRGRGTYCGVACQRADRTGENNPRWRGGRYYAVSGYVYVYAPDHPHATKQGYVMEHRLVMEKRLGRYLDPAEQVHHIDHVKDHNSDENLELMESASEHRVHHAYRRPEPCGSCGVTVMRSAAHRRKWQHVFCSRRCAAHWAHLCAL
jgi:hypothetical protein